MRCKDTDAEGVTNVIKLHASLSRPMRMTNACAHTHTLLIRHIVNEDKSHHLADVTVLHRCKVSRHSQISKQDGADLTLHFVCVFVIFLKTFLPSGHSSCDRGRCREHTAHYTWYSPSIPGRRKCENKADWTRLDNNRVKDKQVQNRNCLCLYLTFSP